MTSNDTPEMVYADNAATTRLSQRAYESMLPFLRDNFGNPSQPYAFPETQDAPLKLHVKQLPSISTLNPRKSILLLVEPKATTGQ